MTGEESEGTTPSPGVGRRALLGGTLGAAAVGLVGFEVGKRSASAEGDDDATASSPADASGVTVEPTGELVADDVQAALVDVYDRTGGSARRLDLQVAYELIDDFPPSADQVGALSWTVTAAAGASVQPTREEGGVVAVATAPGASGRAAIDLGLDQQSGLPLFTMEWRVRVDALATEAEDYTLVFGALSSVSDGPADIEAGAFFVYDRSAKGARWWCRTAGAGGQAEADSGRSVDDRLFHRFGITSDGQGLVRFWYDDEAVASLQDSIPGDDDRYGQGLVLAKTAGSAAASVRADWFFLRRELPR